VKNNKFQTFKEIASYIKSTSLDFGDLPDEVWESLALNNSIRANDGMYYVKRDVNLSIPFTDPQNAEQALNLQAEWDAVNIPTLIIRGANSDILSKATLTQMLAKGAFVEAVEIANAGHSPFLYSSQHIQILCDFWGKRA
jgi:pimeloyl-ACP methyl ester carboxylesterase